MFCNNDDIPMVALFIVEFYVVTSIQMVGLPVHGRMNALKINRIWNDFTGIFVRLNWRYDPLKVQIEIRLF